ncbi:MAG: dCTP deaminase [Alphaproteobacteria bacterium]|nr:dCTP deaminase [Alphaproteobacteria bacterium]
MILTDREIHLSLQHGHIKIDPPPGPEAFSSTSVDLTLAPKGSIWPTNLSVPVRPGSVGYSYKTFATQQLPVTFPDYALEPGSFCLAWTREILDLPISSRIAARVEGKSSLARLGLAVHVTAPTIHSGFKGQIQLEIANLGPLTIVLDPGMRICQLIFEQTIGTPEAAYRGAFHGQSGS